MGVDCVRGLRLSLSRCPLTVLTYTDFWEHDRYILLQPLLRIFAKTPTHAVQSVLHALFLPTPFKFASTSQEDSSTTSASNDQNHGRLQEEALKPGALYADCSVVRLPLLNPQPHPASRSKTTEDKKYEKGDETGQEQRVADDGEYGGEEMGRLVWESFEEALKKREKEEDADVDTNPSDKKKD